MHRAITGIFVAGGLFLAGVACAAAPPVIVTHKLAGFSKETTTSLSITVHVENQGENVITGLSLSFAPSSLFVPERVTLNIGSLAPCQSVDLPLLLKAPISIPADEVSRRPLFWTGKSLDAQGQAVEFPVTSLSGGDL